MHIIRELKKKYANVRGTTDNFIDFWRNTTYFKHSTFGSYDIQTAFVWKTNHPFRKGNK